MVFIMFGVVSYSFSVFCPHGFSDTLGQLAAQENLSFIVTMCTLIFRLF